jgi:hypothetical protein
LSFSTGTFQRRSLTCRIHDNLMTGTVECSGMDPNLAWSSRIGFPCVLSHRHGPIFPWIPNCRLLILLFDLYITFELQSVVFQHTSRATQLKTSNVLEWCQDLDKPFVVAPHLRHPITYSLQHIICSTSDNRLYSYPTGISRCSSQVSVNFPAMS